jgi:hypothetical protein
VQHGRLVMTVPARALAHAHSHGHNHNHKHECTRSLYIRSEEPSWPVARN